MEERGFFYQGDGQPCLPGHGPAAGQHGTAVKKIIDNRAKTTDRHRPKQGNTKYFDPWVECRFVVYTGGASHFGHSTMPALECHLSECYNAAMLGPLVNTVAIIVCSFVGCFLIRGIPDRFEQHIKKALGLAISFVGIKGALDNQNVLLLIMSIVIGSVLGELIDIDKWMNRFGLWAEQKLKAGKPQTQAVKQGHSFSKGFVSASILFCTGSMAIVGSLQSGLQGNHELLYAKSILDGCISLIFGASFGIGVAFSALSVLVYQGSITLASQAIRGYLTPDIIREMSSVGSLVVTGIGLNFLGINEIKVANMIPAIFIRWIWLSITGLF